MLFDYAFLEVGLLAVLIDRIAGYPDSLYRTIGHPVVWIGYGLKKLENRLNQPGLPGLAVRVRGIIALLILLVPVCLMTILLNQLLGQNTIGIIILAILGSSLLAQKSLRQHAGSVICGLENNLTGGRKAVSKIVGRDTSELGHSDICKATIESVAENTSDGFIAPLFWLIVAGLPGIAIYKAVNTADSMIGYKSEKYREFGWFSARVDDLVNLPASRLTGLLFAASGLFHKNGQSCRAVKTMWNDAPKHVSPNAGWPEAAMAGALDFQLGGPRKYEGKLVNLSFVGSGRSILTVEDIKSSLHLYDILLNLVVLILVTTLFLLK